MSAVLQERAMPTSLSVTLNMTDEIRASLRMGETAVAEAKEYAIESVADAQLVAEEMNGYKRAITKLETLKKGFVAPAKEIIKNADELFNPSIQGYSVAEQHCKALLTGWDHKERQRVAEETARREAEERRARQKADQDAAAARARAEEEARAKREAAAKAEADRELAEREGNAAAAREAAAKAAKLTQQADAAIENGNAKAAEAHIAAAAATTALPVPAAEKVSGISMRDKWVAKLKPDLTLAQAKALIVRAIVQDNRPDLLGVLDLNESAIRKLAEGLHEAMDIPGFEAKNEPIVAGKRS